MLVKVCGIKYQDNLDSLKALKVDMVGFNFYPPSSRYIDSPLDISRVGKINKVGVFVNEEISEVIKKVDDYQLQYVQLHGNESSSYCEELYEIVGVIKVFSIAEKADFEKVKEYTDVDLFLFDTKTPLYGGSGVKFSWSLLKNYQGKTPFLLAGGIKLEDAEHISKIDHPLFVGVDINSGFEEEPGRKDIEAVAEFITKLNT